MDCFSSRMLVSRGSGHRDLLDLEVVGVYALEPEAVDDALLAALKKGDLFRFPFNYGADYNCETAPVLFIGMRSLAGRCSVRL